MTTHIVVAHYWHNSHWLLLDGPHAGLSCTHTSIPFKPFWPNAEDSAMLIQIEIHAIRINLFNSPLRVQFWEECQHFLLLWRSPRDTKKDRGTLCCSFLVGHRSAYWLLVSHPSWVENCDGCIHLISEHRDEHDIIHMILYSSDVRKYMLKIAPIVLYSIARTYLTSTLFTF